MGYSQTFIQEIYFFLNTITISNPYLPVRYADDINEIMRSENLRDEDNPYYVRLQGEYFNTTIPGLEKYNDEVMWVAKIDNINTQLDSTLLDVDNITGNTITVNDGVFIDDSFVGDTISFSRHDIVLRILEVIDANNIRVEDNTLAFDDLGEVTRLGTNDIIFNKENMAKSILYRTATYLRTNKAAMDTLFLKYPKQTDLIKNILFPITLTFDINSGAVENVTGYELLGYGDGPLEVAELPSITESISTFLTLYKSRWDVPEYIEFEKYAYVVAWTVVWSVLPSVILKQRIANMHTSRAHTELIWDYLTSKGLGDYRDVLTRSQQIFLYKNYRYLHSIRGTNKALRILNEKLLNPYNIALYSKDIVLSSNDTETKCKPLPYTVDRAFIDMYKPISSDVISMESLALTYNTEVESELEPGYGPQLLAEQDYRISHSQASKLPTKLINFSNDTSFFMYGTEFIRFSFESMIYWIQNDLVDFQINISSIGTDKAIVLTPKEALLLLMYTMHSETSENIHLEEAVIDKYIGRNMLIGGTKIELTEENKAENLDHYRDIGMPAKIPNTFVTSRPFKLDVIAEDLDLDIQLPTFIDPNISNTSQYVSLTTSEVVEALGPSFAADGQTVVSNKTLITESVTLGRSEDIAEKCVKQFDDIYADTYTVRNSSELSYHRIFDRFYEQIIVRGKVDIDFTGDLGVTDYEEWFDTNINIRNMIDYIDSHKSRGEKYAELTTTLLDSLLPVIGTKYFKFGDISYDDTVILRNLFVQLCSYDLAFFKTKAPILDHIVFSPCVDVDTNIPRISLLATSTHEIGVASGSINTTYNENATAPEYFGSPLDLSLPDEDIEGNTYDTDSVSLFYDMSGMGSPISGDFTFVHYESISTHIGIERGGVLESNGDIIITHTSIYGGYFTSATVTSVNADTNIELGTIVEA